MSATLAELERAWVAVFRRHLERGDEESLHEAYELGRRALDEGCGVLDMVLLLWRASHGARGESGPGATAGGADAADGADAAEGSAEVRAESGARLEALLLESMSPFEMLARGAREAAEALRRLEERREEETRRVAHALHDESAQLLATVFFALDDLRQYVARDGLARLDQVENLLGAVEEDIRRIAYDLRPAVLDELGLLPALHSLAANVHRRSGLHVQVEARLDDRVAVGLENALYRAVQEALNNVVRHARARHVRIVLRRGERELNLVVLDDGVGFDARKAFAAGGRRGLGLEGMRERLAPFEGNVEIRSQPGSGTEVRIRVPIEVTHANAIAAG